MLYMEFGVNTKYVLSYTNRFGSCQKKKPKDYDHQPADPFPPPWFDGGQRFNVLL